MDYLRFSVDGQQYALDLMCVRKALPSVWISPLHNCPSPVIGVINFHGLIISVVDLRECFHLQVRSIGLTDRFIWIEVEGWNLILVAAHVEGVDRVADELIIDSATLPATPALLKGMVALPDGVLLIQNPAALLNLREREILRNALDLA